MKGIVRVGILAKCLLISGDKEVDLVTLCCGMCWLHLLMVFWCDRGVNTVKPTRKLLEAAGALLPFELPVGVHSSIHLICPFLLKQLPF